MQLSKFINMSNLKGLVAIVLAIGIVYVAFGAIQRESHSGSELTFSVSRGVVSIDSNSEQPIVANATSRSAFRFSSPDRQVSIVSAREGSGRSTVHRFEGEIPAGAFDLQLSNRRSGGSIDFELANPDGVNVTLIPRSTSSSVLIMLVAVAAAAALLYYASRTNQHMLVRRLATSFPANRINRKRLKPA